MSRTIVTPELAETLRAIRLKNNISAKSLASHINKSPAYITKLEKCGLKSIDNKLIDEILKFIISDDLEGEKIAEEIYSSLKLRYNKREIAEQLWFLNYDTVLRMIPVPSKLIDFFYDKIKGNKIEIPYLLSRINSNEALSEEEIKDESIEFNNWYSFKNDGVQSIKIKLDFNQVNEILNKTVTVAPYVVIFCILFYILKIEKFGDTVKISGKVNQDLMDETTNILNKFKFYSLVEKNNIIANAETEEQLKELLSSFDYENQEILSKILSEFKFASEVAVDITNKRLNEFESNLRWDIWFMLRIVSLDYKGLSETSTTLKKDFINEVDELIERYKTLPQKQKSIEIY